MLFSMLKNVYNKETVINCDLVIITQFITETDYPHVDKIAQENYSPIISDTKHDIVS